MSREPGAVLFDVDDTLYPRRPLVLSGFAAIAAELARDRGVDRRQAFAIVRDAWRGDGRGHELESFPAPASSSPDASPDDAEEVA